jgi:hypothetical protein
MNAGRKRRNNVFVFMIMVSVYAETCRRPKSKGKQGREEMDARHQHKATEDSME